MSGSLRGFGPNSKELQVAFFIQLLPLPLRQPPRLSKPTALPLILLATSPDLADLFACPSPTLSPQRLGASNLGHFFLQLPTTTCTCSINQGGGE